MFHNGNRLFSSYVVLFPCPVMHVCSFTLAYGMHQAVFTYSSPMQQGADSMPRKQASSSQEDLRHSPERKTHKQDICVKLHHLGCQLCFSSRSRDASFLKNTYLHRLIGEHEAKIFLIPGMILSTSLVIFVLRMLFEAV